MSWEKNNSFFFFFRAYSLGGTRKDVMLLD